MFHILSLYELILRVLMNLSLDLYKKLFLIRAAEEAIIKYYCEDEMKSPMHMSMGEEAIVVGICHALTEHDQVLGTYRSHALFLSKTQDVDSFFAEMYGKSTGTADGKSGSMHLSDPDKGMLVNSAIVSSSISTAVGVALANKMQNNDKITVAFFGDGATDAGSFWESLNFACLHELPIIFVLEDNGIAVHTSDKKRQGYNSIAQLVSQYRCEWYEESTTDVEKIHRLANVAINRLKSSARPVFLKLSYYRYLEHVGINNDFHDNYRDEKEYLDWLEIDPIKVQRSRLIRENKIREQELVELESMISQQVEQSVQTAKNAPFSSIQTLYEDVYQ